jgi:SP family myo-inositol transporter-like MFS transporter 13
MAGFSDQDSIWLATVPAAANFFFTIVGLLLVERIGRRKLLIGSVTGTIFGFLLLSATFVLMDYNTPSANPLKSNECLYYSCSACVGNSKCGFCVEYDPVTKEYQNGTCMLGTEHHDGTTSSKYHPVNSNVTCAILGDSLSNETEPSDLSEYYNYVKENSTDTYKRQWHFNGCPDDRFAYLAIVALFIYIAFFAPGMGPLPWTINSEIYPTWARSTAIAIATLVNWCANLVISMTFLTLADTLGQPPTFGLYASLSFLALVFFVFLVPETRGRTLENVEELFQRPYCISWCKSEKKERERRE